MILHWTAIGRGSNQRAADLSYRVARVRSTLMGSTNIFEARVWRYKSCLILRKKNFSSVTWPWPALTKDQYSTVTRIKFKFSLRRHLLLVQRGAVTGSVQYFMCIDRWRSPVYYIYKSSRLLRFSFFFFRAGDFVADCRHARRRRDKERKRGEKR